MREDIQEKNYVADAFVGQLKTRLGGQYRSTTCFALMIGLQLVFQAGKTV